VDLASYLDTGLFLDRRLFRALIRAEAAGRSVLNLFCYTASLSVAAAAGGASRVDSVDISNTYLDWAKKNFRLNGFTADGRNYRFIRADALRFIEEVRGKAKDAWDIIILDPPAFSNSKKMESDFDLKRDHGILIQNCLKLLAPRGALYLSANVKGFKPGTIPGAVLKDISEKLRDEDFRGKRIPSTYRFLL
jgi:23S rRNA G2069 N7-methylase RlmK/C1962 C5-methylase RlmI